MIFSGSKKLIMAGCTFLVLWGAVVCAESTSKSDSQMQEYLFLQGKKLYDAGRPDQAVNVWKNITSGSFYDPVLHILAARSYAKLDRYDLAEAQLKRFFKQYRTSPYHTMAEKALFQALYAQGKEEAIKLASKLLAGASDKQKREILLHLARLRRQLGRNEKAVTDYKKLFLKRPASPEGLAAAQELAWMVLHEKIPRPKFTEHEQLMRAKRLFAKGRFDLAAYTYKSLLKKYPDDVRLGLKYAECLYRRRRNESAITLLNKLLSKKLPPKSWREATHLLCLLYWRTERGKEFRKCCKALITEGDPEYRRKALFFLGAHHLELGRLDDAEKYFVQLLKSGPKPAMAASVKWKIAWVLYRKRDFARAATCFLEAGKASTDGGLLSPSRYWRARSLLQCGKPAEAEKLLRYLVGTEPLSYYGRQAARLLEARDSKVPNRTDRGRSFPHIKLTNAQKSNHEIATAIKLMSKGLHEFALLNLESLPYSLKSQPPIVFLRAKAAYRSNQYHKAYRILNSKFGGLMKNPPYNTPRIFIEIAYPRVNLDHTVQVAGQHEVDPHLVWAVMRQESQYDPEAVSPAGALGLMQVTPSATGKVSKEGKIPAKIVTEILQPSNNVGYGVKILASNLRSFKGSLVPALASYNADIRKVREWVKRNGKMKQDEFIENMPYRETRLYVKKVLAGYLAYRELHKRNDLASRW